MVLQPKGPVLGQISVLLGKWLFGRPEERQASSDAADAGLGVSSDAAAAGLGVSSDAAAAGLGVSSDAAAAAGLGVSASHVATWLSVFVWQGVHTLDQNRFS